MRPPALRACLGSDELVIDNFAGGGGASTGVTAAIGRPVDIAINHNAAAIAMHAANHPETKHYQEDVWEVDPREVCGGKRVAVAWFSPDCFPAGTMVLTSSGYTPIERVRVGDLVLTHKQRWRHVTETHTAKRPLIELRGHGHPGLRVSPEHPFLVRRRRQRHRGHSFDRPDWAPASMLSKSWYWSTPTRPEPLAVVEMELENAKQHALPFDARLLWLAGRYLGDGWTRLTNTRAEIVIVCGKREARRLGKQLDKWPRRGQRSTSGELAWSYRKVRTGGQYTANCRPLVRWLREQFGHGAAHKKIPGWVYGLSRPLRLALLRGYMGADGWQGSDVNGRPVHEASTVSKALAFSLRTLATTLGYTATMYKAKPNKDTIEGRKVRVKPAWKLRWRTSIIKGHAQTFVDDGLSWSPIRAQKPVAKSATVFNLAVEEDESFVVDGVIVHNCTHFSKAKGSQPRKQEIRGLAWVVVRWAETVRPDIIFLENVEEFQTWGPLGADGRPDPEQLGQDFRAWLGRLSDLGYKYEYKLLVAADYGTPTTRRRLFIVLRCDGQPIVWPEATHGAGRSASWRPAADVIDWSLPCPSIFDRAKPLAEATLKRIAKGIEKFIFKAPNPFIVTYYGQSSAHSINNPLSTVTTNIHHALTAPFLAPVTHQGDSRVHDPLEPFRTITAANRGELVLVSPFIVRHGHYSTKTGAGLIEGCGAGTFRGQPLETPLATVCATNDKHLVMPWVVKHYGGPNGQQTPGSHLGNPLGTVTAVDHNALGAAFLTKFYGTSTGAPMDEPLPTVTASGQHIGEVRAFLMKYHGGQRGDARGQMLLEPIRTIDTSNRFGLVTVRGHQYQIVDIGMRMLQPHELFAAQGFPDSYNIRPMLHGKPISKTDQIALAGNSVCPQVAQAIVEANLKTRRQRPPPRAS